MKAKSIIQKLHYISYAKLSKDDFIIQNAKKPSRELNSKYTDNISYKEAFNLLSKISNNKVFELIVSIEAQQYFHLAHTGYGQYTIFKKLIRQFINSNFNNLILPDFVFSIHLNTKNPHGHIILPYEIFDIKGQQQIIKQATNKIYSNEYISLLEINTKTFYAIQQISHETQGLDYVTIKYKNEIIKINMETINQCKQKNFNSLTILKDLEKIQDIYTKEKLLFDRNNNIYNLLT
ncbi:MAG: hypothetical protein N2505_00120 [Endomicrobia bacterium]|nr:hypothetical protein [Endomicrobiia bacterium]